MTVAPHWRHGDTGDMPLTEGPATQTLCYTVGHCDSHLGTPKWSLHAGTTEGSCTGYIEDLVVHGRDPKWSPCAGDAEGPVLETRWTLYWGHWGYCAWNTADPVLRTPGTLGWAGLWEHCDRHGVDPKWSPCAGDTGPVLDHGVTVGETQHAHPMGHPVLGQGDPTLGTLGIVCVSPLMALPRPRGFRGVGRVGGSPAVTSWRRRWVTRCGGSDVRPGPPAAWRPCPCRPGRADMVRGRDAGGDTGTRPQPRGERAREGGGTGL